VRLTAAFLALLLVACTAGSGPVVAAPQAPAAGVATNPAPPIGALDGPWRVVRVVDGDTFEVRKGDTTEKVRLIGIDTPESYPGRKLDRDVARSGQDAATIMALGKQAKAFAESLVGGRDVLLEADAEPRDRYGRRLAYVWVDGPGGRTLVNHAIARAGFAETLTIAPNVRRAGEFRAAVAAARAEGAGLWGQGGLVADGDVRPAAPSMAPAGGDCATQGKLCPADCPVKGNINAKGDKIAHPPGGQFYDRTTPEACFVDLAAAQAAGFRASRR
jgi:micrococcal nuclease